MKRTPHTTIWIGGRDADELVNALALTARCQHQIKVRIRKEYTEDYRPIPDEPIRVVLACGRAKAREILAEVRRQHANHAHCYARVTEDAMA